jgi:hypothetical protein
MGSDRGDLVQVEPGEVVGVGDCDHEGEPRMKPRHLDRRAEHAFGGRGVGGGRNAELYVARGGTRQDRQGGDERSSLGGISGIPQRCAERHRARHPVEHAPERVRLHGAERTLRGVLRVHDVGAAVQRGFHLERASDAHEQFQARLPCNLLTPTYVGA